MSKAGSYGLGNQKKKNSEMETQNLMRRSHVHPTLWKFEIAFQLSHGVEGLIMVEFLGKYGFKPSRAASLNTDGVSCTQNERRFASVNHGTHYCR